MRVWTAVVFIAVIIGSGPKAAFAQSADTATVIGTVVDAQLGLLPGVSVTARNVDTGFTRAVVSEGNGFYRLQALPPGRYEFEAQLAGFQTMKRSGVTLTLNSQTVIDFTMGVAGLQESLTVTADSPIVETTTAQVGTTITRETVDLLPLVGRSVFSLVRLSPGAENSNGVSFTGARGRSNQWLIDGVDNSADISGYNRQEFAIDSIKEFQILVNSFKAEYGRASGGVINVVTRSGTNNVDGNALFLFRNQDLIARDPFASEKEPFERIHYGGTIGGPIVRDRTHYFATYEREDRETTSDRTFVLPASTAPFSPGTLQFFRTQGIDLSLFGNGGTTRLTRPEFVDVHKLNLKVDHRFNDDQTLTTRYTLESDSAPSGTSGTLHDFSGATDENRNQFGNVAHKWVIGSTMLNEAYLQVGQTTLSQLPAFPNLPNIDLPGTTTFDIGASSNFPQERTDYVYQAVNAFTWLKPDTRLGDHSFKTGADVKVFRSDGYFDSNFRGTFTFPSLQALIDGRPSRFTQQRGDSQLARPNTLLGFYAQDDWRASPSLTLNFGLRYDYESAKTEALRGVTGEPGPGIGGDRNNFSPRFGFIWAPGASTKHAIHGGTGLYYDQVILNVIGNARFTPPKVIGVQIDNPGFPDPFGGIVRTPVPDINVIDPELTTPYAWQSSIGYRRELATDIGLDVTYVHNRQYDQVAIIERNAGREGSANLLGSGAIRPDPSANSIDFYTNMGFVRYNGLLVELRKRYSRGFQAGLSYTLSKTEDNSFNFLSDFDVPTHPELNVGPGSDDRRHRLTAHAEVNLPWGFQVGTIVDFATEAPLDIMTSRDLNGDGLTGEWVNESICVNIACPGFRYSRNSVRELTLEQANALRALFGASALDSVDDNPKLRTVDLTLQKRLRLTGDHGVRLTAEVFNLFNWPRYQLPEQNINSNLFGQITGIADITNGPTRIRALQFTVQYDF